MLATEKGWARAVDVIAQRGGLQPVKPKRHEQGLGATEAFYPFGQARSPELPLAVPRAVGGGGAMMLATLYRSAS